MERLHSPEELHNMFEELKKNTSDSIDKWETAEKIYLGFQLFFLFCFLFLTRFVRHVGDERSQFQRAQRVAGHDL
jgi:hypothetical protein